jgi:hypothetical protein
MEKQEEKSNGLLKFLGIGCLTFIILGGLASWYVVKNIKSITAEVAQSIAETLISKTQLSENDKNELMLILDEITEEVKKGEITEAQFSAMLKSFSESGLLPALALHFFENSYLNEADLSQEEKDEMIKQLSRYRWGLINDKVKYFTESNTKIMDIVSVKTDEGSEFKEKLTKDELLAAVQIMRETADSNEIGDKKYEIEVGKEIRKVLDRAKEQALEQVPSETK